VYSLSKAPSSRARCKGDCDRVIEKGELRLSVKAMGRFGHPEIKHYCKTCAVDLLNAQKAVCDCYLNKIERGEVDVKADG
jgi:hypothetical protein